MKLPFSKKKSQPELGLDVAEQMLQHIYQVCDFEPSTVPLEVLTSYSNYRKERYNLQRSGIVVVLALFLLLPLLFIASTITLSSRNSGQKANPVYDILVSTQIPVQTIQATIGGRSVPIQEAGSRRYIIKPNANGLMTVTVTLINQQITTMEVEVEEVDNARPVLLSSDFDAECFYLYVMDEDSGIDYEAVEVRDEVGGELKPMSWDEEEGCITLAYPQSVLNVTIPDLKGNELHLKLRPE